MLVRSTPGQRDLAMDLGPGVAAMRERLPADTIICNGAGNYSGWWHRYWHYAGPVCQLAPTAGAMGYGVPAATAAALRHKDRQVVALAGDGCFLMNGQELATAVAHGARSEEHTSELQSLMRISYAVFCLKKKNKQDNKK